MNKSRKKKRETPALPIEITKKLLPLIFKRILTSDEELTALRDQAHLTRKRTKVFRAVDGNP